MFNFPLSFFLFPQEAEANKAMYLLINIFKEKIYSLRQKNDEGGEEEGEEKKRIIRRQQKSLLSLCLDFIRGGKGGEKEKEGEVGGVVTCEVFEQVIFLLEGDCWEEEGEEKKEGLLGEVGVEERLLIYRKFIFCFPWRGLAMVLKGLCGVYEWGMNGSGEGGKERVEIVKG